MSGTNRRFTVCVDFDGVIAEYGGWKGHKHFGEPKLGAKDALEMMKDRNPTIQGNNPGKPIADVYVDGNAVRFTGWLNTWFILDRINQKVYKV